MSSKENESIDGWPLVIQKHNGSKKLINQSIGCPFISKKNAPENQLERVLSAMKDEGDASWTLQRQREETPQPPLLPRVDSRFHFDSKKE